MECAPTATAPAALAAQSPSTDLQPAADQWLPAAPLAVLGLQHVLVMVTGAVAVPLMVGRALQLPAGDAALLISATLLCCGLATVLQSLGLGRQLGVRLPVVMGVTFAAAGPMVAMAGSGGAEAARALFGAVIGAGLVGLVAAPLMGRLLRLFPPVVTGTIVAVIGLTLLRVAVGWTLGGPAGMAQLPGTGGQANPAYGALADLGLAAFVLAAIVLVARQARGFLANVAVLLGLAAGCLLAAGLGRMRFDAVAQAPWFAPVTPFAFGPPVFEPVQVATLALVMLVVMVESIGMFAALGELAGRPLAREALTAGLRVNALATVLGGVLNSFPQTSYSQNVGLVGLTGVASRFVCVAAGVLLVALGLVPKTAALVAAVPTCVLGGAALVMFGMVAATGIRILGSVDFQGQRHNLQIVAISLGLGLLPMLAPHWAQHLPRVLHPLLESGIVLAALSAVVLNLLLGGAARQGEASASNRPSPLKR